MPGYEYGLRRALMEVVGGLITSSVLLAFRNSGLLSPSYFLLFDLASIAGMVLLIFAMPYWGTTYLLGWLTGLGLMFNYGLMGTLEFVAYLLFGLAILAMRILKSATGSRQ